jgi:hypothetical protein
VVPYSERYFHCGQISSVAELADSSLWYSASGKPEHARYEERDQRDDEYDLCGGERGSGYRAEAERTSDQSNDKKGDRPAKHDVLLTPRWLLSS